MRYARILQVVAGLSLLIGSYFMGRINVQLLSHGSRTAGRIVGYKQESLRDKSQSTVGSTAYMPIVEYQLGAEAVHFEDWLGSPIAGDINKPVRVLYDPANPSIAMIDREIWNWLPWGPVLVVGAFLLLTGSKNLLFPSRSSTF